MSPAAERPAPSRPALIGVFDSGVGGLSVLGALRKQLPDVDLLYLADSAHAPYGERSDAFIAARTHRLASHLLAHGAQLLVLACNTASAVAASSLRTRWTTLPIVAVEPGVKPAASLTHNGRIGVMATPATLRSRKFQRLLKDHGKGQRIHLQACPGLAGRIEQGDSRDPEMLELIHRFTRPLKKKGVDTVVLGCTHYPFAATQIQQAMGQEVRLVDTADAVARQAAWLWTRQGFSITAAGRTRLQTTGDPRHLAGLARRWLGLEGPVAHAPGL